MGVNQGKMKVTFGGEPFGGATNDPDQCRCPGYTEGEGSKGGKLATGKEVLG